jgi:hypothetical protein
VQLLELQSFTQSVQVAQLVQLVLETAAMAEQQLSQVQHRLLVAQKVLVSQVLLVALGQLERVLEMVVLVLVLTVLAQVAQVDLAKLTLNTGYRRNYGQSICSY